MTEFTFLGQTTHLKDATKEGIYARIRAAWSCFRKKRREILQDRQIPISLKKKTKQVMDQCVLPTMTYGCQTCPPPPPPAHPTPHPPPKKKKK